VLKEFKAFALRGNMIDLAVGIVIGAAFGAIVNSLVKDVFTPLLGLLNVPDFSNRGITVGKDTVKYGVFVNSVISFLVIAAAVFFIVVKPVNRFMSGGETEEEPKMRECPHCLSSVPKAAKVCAHCTREVGRSPARKR
jgi:large conductance mechanosensitive channel